MDELKVFTGNAHSTLAKSVTDYLGIPLGNVKSLSSAMKTSSYGY